MRSLANELELNGWRSRWLVTSVSMGEVARLRGDLLTVLETSPVGDSQSNGFVERAVRSIEEMVRTHKIALEAKDRRGGGNSTSITPQLFG